MKIVCPFVCSLFSSNFDIIFGVGNELIVYPFYAICVQIHSSYCKLKNVLCSFFIEHFCERIKYYFDNT